MGESTKAASALVMIVAAIAAVVAWAHDRPDTTTWAVRIGGSILALLALGVILKLHFRPDHALDYLRNRAGTYFNRDGFCFAFVSTAVDGVAYMDAYFQNQRNRPCVGRIAMRPARGFFMGRAEIEAITYEVECGPAAFGVARVPIPVPEKLQGKRQSFEVGASVEYPQGKGERLRFHDGVFLRSNSKFGNSFGTALTVAGAATGSIVLSKPATATVDLPDGVTENIDDSLSPDVKTLWKLGDPELESVA